MATYVSGALIYESATGKFYRYACGVCKLINTRNHDGYIRTRFQGKAVLGQRIAFKLVTGEWPSGEIDHINRDRSDNRWENLRIVSRSENCANSRAKSTNLSGVKGIRKTRNGKWQARVTKDGATHNLGTFESPELAIASYQAKFSELYRSLERTTSQ